LDGSRYPHRDKRAPVFLGLTRGEAALSLVVFLLIYGGVVLPRFGEGLGVFLVRRLSKSTTTAIRPPKGGEHKE
jgi:hypothetical protein